MIKLLYFASLRETLGIGGEEMVLPAGIADIAALRAHLAARGGPWTAFATSTSLRAAINQAMAASTGTVEEGDEIAFFPPVTGG